VSGEPHPQGGRARLALLLALYLGLRALFLLTPGYADDLKAYKRWAVAAASSGIARVYADSDMDYPPAYAYVLAPLGRTWLALTDARERRRGLADGLWTALAKLPPLAGDLVTAALLFALGRRRDRATGLVLAWAYLLNPAVLFDTGHWGHPDSLLGALALGAFWAVGARPALAAVLLSLALWTKPLAAPLVPLLGALVLRRHGLRGALRAAAAAAAASLLVFAPFLAGGHGRIVMERVAGDLDAMPFTSVNAHNLWFTLGPWRSAEAPLVGRLTATEVGMLLFGAFTALVVARAWRLGDASVEQRMGLAALSAAGFFLLATHMHENHLFTALPLLAALVASGRGWRVAYAALSLALLLNLVLHDPVLAGLGPLRLGGLTDVPRPSHGRSYYAAELLAVRAATAYTLTAITAVAAWGLCRSRLLAPPPESRDHEGLP
jgi:hypothetical protein